MNSSPPMRALMSVLRVQAFSRRATSFRTSSPACPVARAVVDGLEIVQIDVAHGHEMVGAGRQQQGLFEQLVQVVLVVQPGQGVAVGEFQGVRLGVQQPALELQQDVGQQRQVLDQDQAGADGETDGLPAGQKEGQGEGGPVQRERAGSDGRDQDEAAGRLAAPEQAAGGREGERGHVERRQADAVDRQGNGVQSGGAGPGGQQAGGPEDPAASDVQFQEPGDAQGEEDFFQGDEYGVDDRDQARIVDAAQGEQQQARERHAEDGACPPARARIGPGDAAHPPEQDHEDEIDRGAAGVDDFEEHAGIPPDTVPAPTPARGCEASCERL